MSILNRLFKKPEIIEVEDNSEFVSLDSSVKEEDVIESYLFIPDVNVIQQVSFFKGKTQYMVAGVIHEVIDENGVMMQSICRAMKTKHDIKTGVHVGSVKGKVTINDATEYFFRSEEQ